MALGRRDDSSESLNEYDSPDLKDKDATELELEKLVFGDELGFYDGLKSTINAAVPETGKDAEFSEDNDAADGLSEEGLEGVDDADVRT